MTHDNVAEYNLLFGDVRRCLLPLEVIEFWGWPS